MTYEELGRPRVPNLHFQQLRYLREVERSATLTEAAERLHVSQPALSQALAQLERRLGVSLFERDGRRRVLTTPGARSRASRTRCSVARRNCRTRLAAQRRGEAGTLRVGMIDAASLYVLPETIRRFRAAHPAVDLRLVSTRVPRWSRGSTRSSSTWRSSWGRSAATTTRFRCSSEPLYVYAPRGVLERPEDGSWVLYPSDSQTRALIDAGLARSGLRPRVTLESSNPEILRQMVVLGLGWSVLPPAVAESQEPSLEPLLAGAPLPRARSLGVRREPRRAGRARGGVSRARGASPRAVPPIADPGRRSPAASLGARAGARADTAPPPRWAAARDLPDSGVGVKYGRRSSRS